MITYVLMTLVLLACSCLFVGLKVPISGRPFFLHLRYVFAWAALAYSLPVAILLSSLSSDVPISFLVLALLNLMLFSLVFMLYWRQTKGYWAIGIRSESFREALRHSLSKQDLPFHDWISGIRLPLANGHLEIAADSPIGIGQFKLAESTDSAALRRLIQDMKAFYRSDAMAPNNTASVFFIALGTFWLILIGVLIDVVASWCFLRSV